MLVRFWGTRGSLPVAPTADSDQAQDRQRAGCGRRPAVCRCRGSRGFVEHGTRASRPGATYGGATSCVEIEAGDGSYFICDMGSGLRPFGLDSLRPQCGGPQRRPTISSCPTCTGTTSWASPSSRRRSIPSARSSSTPAIPTPSRRCAASRRKSPSRCRSTGCAAKFEFVQLTPGEAIEVDGVRVETMLPAPFARQLRLPLHRAARADGGLQHRQRAQARQHGRPRRPSSASSATPTWSFATPCIRSPKATR